MVKKRISLTLDEEVIKKLEDENKKADERSISYFANKILKEHYKIK